MIRHRESSYTKQFRDGTIVIDDGINRYEVRAEEGNLTWNVPGTSVALFLDRGRIADEVGGRPDIRLVDDAPVTGTLSARLRDLTDHTKQYDTLADFTHRSGRFGDSTWRSTLGEGCDVKTLNVTLFIARGPDPFAHWARFPYCYLTGGGTEGNSDMLNVSFTSYCLYPFLH